MESVTINFEKQVSQYGNSVAVATVKAESETKAESILDNFLNDKYPDLGRYDSHFQEGNIYYFAITK